MLRFAALLFAVAIAAQAQTAPADLNAAEAAIAKADWQTAAPQLDLWLAAHPNDARALFDAAYVADATNRLEDAAALYRRAITADPHSLEAHLSLGLLLARQGKPAEARPELLSATTLSSNAANAPQLKARAWRALAELDRPTPDAAGNPVAASNELAEALKLSPETPADTLLAAALAEATDQPDAALAAYRRLLQNDPNNTAAHAAIAHLLMRQKDFPAAEAELRAALVQTPDDLALNAELATALAAQDKAEALDLLVKLHAAHPAEPSVTRMLAEVQSEAGEYAASDALYLSLLAQHPNDAVLLSAHGQNLVHLGHFAEALPIFDRVTQQSPSDGAAWSGLAFAASRTQHPDLVIRALTERAKLLPELPSTYFLWATAYDALHQKQQAATYYHHFLDAAKGKFPDQEWQARQRLQLLERK